jgi:hypothetical protein
MIHDLPSDEFQLAAYRPRTIAMVRRYGRAAIELGRLPSLLGREFFRAKVTSYTVHTFEDAIIFAFDMERSLESLTPLERSLLGRLIIQEYTQDDLALRMHVDRGNLNRKFMDSVDHLTEIMLANGLLNPSILQSRFHRRNVTPISDAPTIAPAASSDSAARTPSFVVTPSSSTADVNDAPCRAFVTPVTIDLKACQAPKNGAFAASA